MFPMATFKHSSYPFKYHQVESPSRETENGVRSAGKVLCMIPVMGNRQIDTEIDNHVKSQVCHYDRRSLVQSFAHEPPSTNDFLCFQRKRGTKVEAATDVSCMREGLTVAPTSSTISFYSTQIEPTSVDTVSASARGDSSPRNDVRTHLFDSQLKQDPPTEDDKVTSPIMSRYAIPK